MKRRVLLKTLTAAAISPLILSCARGQAATPVKLGIQLYTLRDQMADDLPGTLNRLAEIGYRELEFAGYYDYSPAEIVTLLRNSGLTAPAAHIGMQAIRDTPQQLIETAASIGHEYLVMSSVVREERGTLDDFRRHAELMNRFAEKCRAAGLQFAYHNHSYEFDLLDGVVPMELLLSNTDPELVQIELDIYWIIKGGADPLAYFNQYPGRFPLCHVKDMAEDGSMTDVGSGTIDFAAIFAASDLAGFRHYFVEHDNPDDSLSSAEVSFAGLSRLNLKPGLSQTPR